MIPTKVFCRYWMTRGEKGSVINLCSMSSYVPLSGVWAYDAAKAGVLSLTMAAAKEFASHGIRVNAIAPGFFVGKQNKALLMDEKTGVLTQRGKDIIARTPFGRFGEPGDLPGAVIFLASERASGFVTGTCLAVDGGFLVDCI
jgi:NAD(P)-dependent dehydrogenase (short-subunit alcohol dehydrogenase family)